MQVCRARLLPKKDFYRFFIVIFISKELPVNYQIEIKNSILLQNDIVFF